MQQVLTAVLVVAEREKGAINQVVMEILLLCPQVKAITVALETEAARKFWYGSGWWCSGATDRGGKWQQLLLGGNGGNGQTSAITQGLQLPITLVVAAVEAWRNAIWNYAGLGGGTSTTAEKGGGGDGSINTASGGNGTANTGGGGGGGGYTGSIGAGGAGGSGIVIIKYTI
jgi:hypothetical protein